MRVFRLLSFTLPALIAALSATAASAAVDVAFVAPEHYTDGGGKGGFGDLPVKAVVEREIRAHLTGLGERNLAPGQTLKIEVLDIDLAGRRDILGSSNGDVRVYDQLNSPRIRLRFTLEEGGQIVSSGEDLLTDPLYLNSLSRTSTGDPLRYERPMLTKWFLGRFGRHSQSG